MDVIIGCLFCLLIMGCGVCGFGWWEADQRYRIWKKDADFWLKMYNFASEDKNNYFYQLTNLKSQQRVAQLEFLEAAVPVLKSSLKGVDKKPKKKKR